MSPGDRSWLPLPLSLIVGVIGASITSAVVELPGGGRSMQGEWAIAIVGCGTTLVALLVFGALFWRRD